MMGFSWLNSWSVRFGGGERWWVVVVMVIGGGSDVVVGCSIILV